ncbi:protein TolR, partial [candidate division GN15 bacterium]|nr:protein TolR [candidate division GN15 bacterium]
MARRPRIRTYHAVSDINIANLVDVVLVLLIVFMISAPLLQSGIEIDLPKTKAAVLDEE